MLKIYNTFSGKKEEFIMNYGDNVNIYVCGITPSDYMHVGHARTFIMFDILIRYLNYLGYKTYYVRNITDLSLKITNKAILNNINYNLYIKKILLDFKHNLEYLNVLKPNYELKISNLVPKSIPLIQQLIKTNYAYIDQIGNIRFYIHKFNKYGNLSRQNINKLYSINMQNINTVFDFVLWKKIINKKEMKYWNSPWGKGYPGWHTGCFTIINEYFYKKNISVDIHGGGHDLIFPHHENEIAQYESLYNKSYVRFWVHIGLILINKKKMSKTFNNLFYLKDILQRYNPEILRAFFLSYHYRQNMNFTVEAINTAKKWLDKLYLTIRKINTNILIESDFESKYENFFVQAMNNDFNTVQSYSILLDMAKQINCFYIKKQHGFANSLAIKLIKLANILGLLNQNPEIYLKNLSYKLTNIDYIVNLIKLRNNARTNKNWVLADNIRKELTLLNIILEDDVTGTKWRRT